MLLIKNVPNPRYPFMTKPPRIHLISEIPDPAAYFAVDLTKWAAVNEKVTFERGTLDKASYVWLKTYGKQHINCPTDGESRAP